MLRTGNGNRPLPPEKAAISEACGAFTADVLRPRLLPEIRPTEFIIRSPSMACGTATNRFLTRCRSDDPRSYKSQCEARLARLNYGGTRDSLIFSVVLQLVAAGGAKYKAPHGETAISGSGGAGSMIQGLLPLYERIKADESLAALARELFAVQAEVYTQ